MAEAPVFSFATLPLDATFEGPGRTLSDTDLALFCMLSTDWGALHADEAYARTTRFGRRIFHGTFGLTVAVAMSQHVYRLTDKTVAALGLREWRYLAPLFIGDTVHDAVRVAAKEVKSGGSKGLVTREVKLVNQDGVVTQSGLTDTLVALGKGGEGT